MSINSGILVVDKPSGLTSFDVIFSLRKHLKIKKIGHMGTLDPIATGVLPVMIGSATKALALVENHEKEYIAGVKFGIYSDTQDITGNIISTSKRVFAEDIESVLPLFTGEIYQIPPMYSAVKKDGIRLYKLARLGQTVERDKRNVHIFYLKVLDFDKFNQTMNICVRCSGGTYIRTLCSDIGEELGCGAVMTSLRRTGSNGFNISDSLSLSNIMHIYNESEINEQLFGIESLFMDLDRVNITYPQLIRFKNGGGLSFDRLEGFGTVASEIRYRVYWDSAFIGIGITNIERQELCVVKVFK